MIDQQYKIIFASDSNWKPVICQKKITKSVRENSLVANMGMLKGEAIILNYKN